MSKNTMPIRHALNVNKNLPDISAIIIGASPGRHCVSYGVKSLFKVNGEPIINKQVRELNKAGIFDIVGVFGFEAARMVKPARDLGVRFIENYYWDYQESGMVRSIDYGLKASVASRIVVIHGDILFTAQSIQDLHNNSSVLVDRAGRVKKTKPGIITADPHQVINFSYGLPDKWCQIALLEGRELTLAQRFCDQESNWKFTTFEMLNSIMESGGRLTYALNQYPLCEIDNHQDIVETRNEAIKDFR